MKPSDFYIGISELFSILMPGFLVVTSTMRLMDEIDIGNQFHSLHWLILFSISYVIGHFLFALGSLWDEANNLLKYHGNDDLLEKVTSVREKYGVNDCLSINNYQWTKAILSIYNNIGYMEVLRKEADSKLFRSIIIPLILLMVYLWVNINWIFGVGVILFVLMAFWRYREQRNKACSIAYTHLIALNMQNKLINN